MQEREQKWKGSWRIRSQVQQKLPEPLKGLDCGRCFKNTTFALLMVYGCHCRPQPEEQASEEEEEEPERAQHLHGGVPKKVEEEHLNVGAVDKPLQVVQPHHVMVDVSPHLPRQPRKEDGETSQRTGRNRRIQSNSSDQTPLQITRILRC